jgi:ligand-binding sensor domain-containing protein/serine phosphatase RsbU (regulator of sigma subunit)
MKRKIVALAGIVLLLFSCTRQPERVGFTINTPKIQQALGYVMPLDSIDSPKIVYTGKPVTVNLREPRIILANTNVHAAGIPNTVQAGLPFITKPGFDTCSLPDEIPAVDTSIIAGTPETVITKEAYTRDQNSQNFSSFGKLQGLKHGIVNCMLQDKFGNIWMGTGGGVTKYDGQTFTHYTETEGLCNNDVLSMLEDKKGNLWFGTHGGGVSRYDGKFFSTFDINNGLADVILSMAEDDKGGLWFAHHDGGVSRYDGKVSAGGHIKFDKFTGKQGFTNKPVRRIFKDKSGVLWFGTEGDGVIKYDGTTFYHYTKKQGLPNNSILTIIEDKESNLWFGTEDAGIAKYDGKYFTWFTSKEGLSSDYISSAIEDKSGNLWFGTFGAGVNKYDGKTFTHYTDNEGLYNNIIFSLLEDRSGNLWLGPYCGGLSKYNGKSFVHFTNKEGLSNNAVFSIVEDKNGALWLGTNGGGLSKYDGKSFTNYTRAEGLTSNSIWAIYKDRSGNLWLGTNGGGVCKFTTVNGRHSFTSYMEKDGLGSNSVRSVLEDRKGNLWFGTEGGGVSVFNGKSFTNYTVKEGLSNNYVFSMVEDNEGNIWLGTYGGGINKFDGKTFVHFTEKEGLCNNSVLSILKDANGNLWFGTSGGGVDKYDGKYFTHFTEKEGLLNNFVLSVLEDRKGNLWFGTRFGLSKLTSNYMSRLAKSYANGGNEQLVLFKNYTYPDGFLGIGCNAKAIYQDKKGTIWIGANDRLTAFHPEAEDADTIPPNVQLTNIELFNENISWMNFERVKDTSLILGNGVKIADLHFDKISNWYNLPEKLSLAHNNNYLTFHYIGVTQKQSKKIKYQYKLDGFDENWSIQTSRTEVPYGNLPQGSYTFKVKAMNSEGYWSNEFSYPFTIRPPWFQTWWFRTVLAVFILLLLYSLYRWRTAALREGKRKLEQTVIERTAEVIHQKDEAEKQRALVEIKQKEILDSIAYAKHIQDAILPSDNLVKKWLPDSFILYKPKDIVAGDFYWVENIEDIDAVIFAAADCTGHGVPGAMVSVICNNALNRVLKEFKYREPGKILDKTRELVIEQFEKSSDDVKDGMDISLCILNAPKNELKWAGANNPLWIIRNKKLMETKADKQPIGRYAETKPFTSHTISLQKGDCIYIFTDGFADQFGGVDGRKLKKAAMQELLLAVQDKTIQEQKQAVDTFFENWKGELEQVDDVCVMGVKY